MEYNRAKIKLDAVNLHPVLFLVCGILFLHCLLPSRSCCSQKHRHNFTCRYCNYNSNGRGVMVVLIWWIIGDRNTEAVKNYIFFLSYFFLQSVLSLQFGGAVFFLRPVFLFRYALALNFPKKFISALLPLTTVSIGAI